jgi:hypothetical protein
VDAFGAQADSDVGQGLGQAAGETDIDEDCAGCMVLGGESRHDVNCSPKVGLGNQF